jgi:hypothetical protein
MADRDTSPDDDKTEFDLIVSRLGLGSPIDAADPKCRDAVALPRRRLSNGAFCFRCLAIILPTAMIVGGWIGILAVIASMVAMFSIALEETT